MFRNELHSGGIKAILEFDGTVFDGFTVPEIFSKGSEFFKEYPELSTITREDIINDIIIRHGDAPLFHPNPVLLKYQITQWARRRRYVWARWYNDLLLDYDPRYNYDKFEDIDAHDKGKVNEKSKGDTTTKDSGHEITTNTLSAENVETWSNDTRSDLELGTTSASNTNSNADTDSANDHWEHNHIYGNIGVTTTMQMIESDFALLKKMDLVKIISDEFRDEFCLDVY